MLESFGLSEANPVRTPLPTGFDVHAHADEPLLRDELVQLYQSIVGSLMYASTTTQPQIAYAVSQLSKVVSCPKAFHLQAAKRVLRYLKGCVKSGIFYPALSTTESEYISMCQCIQEGVWLKHLFGEFGHEFDGGVPMFVDNQSAIALAQNACLHGRTKHMQVRWHFIREMVASGDVILRWCPTNRQAADILTKPLHFERHGASEGPCVGAAATASLGQAFVAGTGTTSVTMPLSFTLYSGASSCFFRDSTDLMPLCTPVTVTLADPSVVPVVAHSTTTLPCPAALLGVLTGYYTPSFSRNLEGVSHLYDLGVATLFPMDEPVATCKDGATRAHLPTFHKEPGSGPYSLHTGSHHVGSGQVATVSCDRWSLTHPSVFWHHYLTRMRFFLIVVDDFSRYTTVFPLRLKANVPAIPEPWFWGIRATQGRSVLRLHSDR
ncbi:unnamed protein product, partial [Closterium sp. NIES-54]